MTPREFPAFFGDWLKQRRRILDLTQEELARRAGCSVFALRKIEGGERRPSKELAAWLANALEIPKETQPIFIRAARGDLNLERLPLPTLAPQPAPKESLSHPLSQLPVYFTPFVGREAELSALVRIFHAPECRLLTLTGLGGIGKTRLAVEYAMDHQGDYPGGVFYVSLASLNAPELIVPAIADAFGLTFSGPTDPKEQLINALAAQLKQPGLFVLDNMEHLLPTALERSSKMSVTDLIVDLLQRVGRAKFLVTSRERLNLQGEWTYELHGLPTPPPIFMDQLEEYSAPVLFLHHARRTKAEFTIGREAQAGVVRICQLLEGIPLALELAATWVGMLTCEEIANEIEANIAFLGTTMRDIPERHRSLRATFDHSWNLLSEEERVTLCQLSVFQGGFNREAAARIAHASLPNLASLVSKSLVRRTESGRYDLHEVIRQFTLSYLLSDPNNLVIRDRHCEYYLTFVGDRERALKSRAQQDTLRELTPEMDNIRAAWVWAIGHERYSLIGKAARGLCWFFETAGLLRDGIEQFELLVQALRHEPRNAQMNGVLGSAYVQQGLLYFRTGQFIRAQETYDESVALLRSVGEAPLLADALIYYGIIVHYNGDYLDAKSLLEEGLAYAEEVDDGWFVALGTYSLGHVDTLMGEYRKGYEQMQAGLEIWRTLGDPHAIALGLNFLVSTLIKLECYDEAISSMLESVALCEQTKNRWGMGTAHRYLGLATLAGGKPIEAQSYFQKSLETFGEYFEGWDIALSLIYLGDAILMSGDLVRAEKTYMNALRLAEETGSIPLMLDALAGIAYFDLHSGKNEEAWELSSIILNHPSTVQETRDRAGQIKQETENSLSTELIQNIKERVSNQSLQETMEKTLNS